MPAAGPVVVIGVGDPMRRDDGVGPAVLDALRPVLAPEVTVQACLGETTELLDAWQGARLAVLVDATRATPAQPGRIHRLDALAAPARAGSAGSHAADLGEVIALARALDRLPARLVVYAVEVADTGYGTGLSTVVSQAVPELRDRIAAEVAAEYDGSMSSPTGPASYIPSIEKKYGKPISAWMEIVSSSPLTKHSELVNWLKTEHGLGHGHATALVHLHKDANQ